MGDKITFKVRATPAGWIVQDGTPIGPFRTKDQAIELAKGMVAAIIRSGHDADYVIEDAARE
jgi:hypothetical protein